MEGLGGVLGRSWGDLGASSGGLGTVLGRLGRVLGASSHVLARLGRILSCLGEVLGASFGYLVRSGPDLKRNLGNSKKKPDKTNGFAWFFEGSGCHLGAKLAQKTVLRAILALLAPILVTIFVRRAS